MNNFVATCNANGFLKNGNYLTLGYITLCHYLKKRLLTSRSQIQAKKLCIHVTNNSNYVGCDCKTLFCVCKRY
jgi:hypothetical protein